MWLMKLLASRRSSTANSDVVDTDKLQQWSDRLQESTFWNNN
jgi:hypothetical protein